MRGRFIGSDNVLEVLTIRFQSVPQELVAELAILADLERLKALLRQAAIVGSVEEFEHIMETSA